MHDNTGYPHPGPLPPEVYKKRTKDARAGEEENLYQGGMGGCRPHSTLDPSFPCLNHEAA